jgi:hypothetical protein
MEMVHCSVWGKMEALIIWLIVGAIAGWLAFAWLNSLHRL